MNPASAFNLFRVQIYVNLRRNFEKNDIVIPFVTDFRDFRNCRNFGDFMALNAYFHSFLGLKCNLVTRIYENELQVALQVRFGGEILENRLVKYARPGIYKNAQSSEILRELCNRTA